MNLAEIDLFRLYQLVLLCAGVTALLMGLRGARRLTVRYRKLPKDFQQAVNRGVYAAVKRFVRKEWPRLIALVSLLVLLAWLVIATRMI